MQEGDEDGLGNRKRDKDKHLCECLVYFIRATNLPEGFIQLTRIVTVSSLILNVVEEVYLFFGLECERWIRTSREDFMVPSEGIM